MPFNHRDNLQEGSTSDINSNTTTVHSFYYSTSIDMDIFYLLNKHYLTFWFFFTMKLTAKKSLQKRTRKLQIFQKQTTQEQN